MAVDFFDGFDDYSTAQINRYWTTMSSLSGSEIFGSQAFDSNIATVSTGGRNNSGLLRCVSSFRSIAKTLAAQASRAMGMAIKINGHSTSNAIAFGDSGTSQITLQINPSGILVVTRGTINGTVLGRSTLALNTGIWYFIEFKATIDNTTGSFTARVNGVDWVTGSGLDTQNTANASANQVGIGCAASGLDFDDFYSEDSGTFQGDCRVETKLPTGDGATNNFTRSTGATNFSNVDENPANDDTDYNSSGTAGDIDLYTFPSMTTTTGTIKSLMTVPILRNDAAGTVTAASAYRISTTNYFGANNNVGSTTFNSYTDIQNVSPATSAAWTISEINGAQYGLKRVV